MSETLCTLRTKGGGGGGAIVIEPDTNNLLGQITTHNASFTATEDCIMCGRIVGNNTSAVIYAGDDLNIQANRIIETKGDTKIGNPKDVTGSKYGIFIPKDTVVRSRNVSGHTYALNFYGLL